ncbi:hypothetical protein Ahia01_000886900 [Argonauta hians]
MLSFVLVASYLCLGSLTTATVNGTDEAIHWTFTFLTGSSAIADSNANQKIILNGTLASSRIITLEEDESYSRFQKKKIDIFNVTTINIGLLTHVTLWNDKRFYRRIGPIWDIEKAELYNHEDNFRYELSDVRVNSQRAVYGVIRDEPPTTDVTTNNPTTEVFVTTDGSTEVTETTTELMETTEVLTAEPLTTEETVTVTEDTFGTTTQFEETTQLEMCYCKCPIPVNRTKEEVKKYLAELKNELSIPKKDTTSYIRKKISAPDHRISAQAAGYIGVVFIILPFAIIIAGDLIKLWVYCCKSSK